MTLFQVDDAGHLFISPLIEDWSAVAAHKIDAVMHFAGSIEVGESVTHPLEYYRKLRFHQTIASVRDYGVQTERTEA